MAEGRTVGLRPITPGDYGPLYQAAMTAPGMTWRNQARSVPPEAFASFLWEGVYCQRAIYPVGDPTDCVGLVSLINADTINQVAYLGVLLDPQRAPSTGGGEALVLWLHHVFTQTPLRKVYAETSELSLRQVRDTVRIPGAVEEGRLKGHIVHGGQQSDLVVLALYRDAVLAALAPTRWAAARCTDQLGASPTAGSVSWTTFVTDLAASELLDRPAVQRLADLSSGGLSLTDDLELDSLRLLEVVTWMEVHYRCTIADQRLTQLGVLQDLFGLLDEPAPVRV
jgi:RimJ/RimL family protein N-acetyltransferase